MGSSHVQKLLREARAGLWRPFMDHPHARIFTEAIVEHFFDLPLGVEAEYLRIVARCIEASPSRCIETFNHLEVMKLPEHDRRESAELACSAIGLYGFTPGLLQGIRDLLTDRSTSDTEPQDVRHAYSFCRIRFLHFCTWLEVYHQQELKLRTSAGTIAAPTRLPAQPVVRVVRPKPKLRLVT